MKNLRPMSFLVVRYVPDVSSSGYVDVGVVLFEKIESQISFAKARFIEDMTPILDIDPGADIEWLQATFRELEQKVNTPSEREGMLRAVQETFSNVLQIVGPQSVLVSENPKGEFDNLVLLHLTPPPQG